MKKKILIGFGIVLSLLLLSTLTSGVNAQALDDNKVKTSAATTVKGIVSPVPNREVEIDDTHMIVYYKPIYVVLGGHHSFVATFLDYKEIGFEKRKWDINERYWSGPHRFGIFLFGMVDVDPILVERT